MKTIKVQLSYSDIMQGIVEKTAYLVGGTAYLKTKSGKEFWFDPKGHLLHKKTQTEEEFRDYHENGSLKCLHKVNQYKVFYNEKGLKVHKITNDNREEFWEYDDNGFLSRWHNTAGHERKYVCNDVGAIIAWYGNETLLSWYKSTNRTFDASFSGLIV